jgi:hypothetical protein
MDGREIEPRVLMWAVAEISWQDAGGTSCRAPATLEDSSKSGACIRVRRPFEVGSMVTIKWHREQFRAVARNCRSDGRDFLLGLKREGDGNHSRSSSDTETVPATKTLDAKPLHPGNDHPLLLAIQAERERRQNPETSQTSPGSAPPIPAHVAKAGALTDHSTQSYGDSRIRAANQNQSSGDPQSVARQSSLLIERSVSQKAGASPRLERKGMPYKPFFPKFWRRQQSEDAPESTISKEVIVNETNAPAAENATGPRAEMLSYEDIYHAAGIMAPRSGYGIHKVVEMLNSERIRDLSPDIKRASVLMALDAAGTPVEDVLEDASRRQQALTSYEAGKKKQLEDFEAGLSREITQIEAEMERIRAHYAERIQQNRDLAAQEKEALRNWQMAMQHESQRIAEVIELCGKPTCSASAAGPGKLPDGTSGSAAGSPQNPVEQARAATTGRTV